MTNESPKENHLANDIQKSSRDKLELELQTNSILEPPERDQHIRIEEEDGKNDTAQKEDLDNERKATESKTEEEEQKQQEEEEEAKEEERNGYVSQGENETEENQNQSKEAIDERENINDEERKSDSYNNSEDKDFASGEEAVEIAKTQEDEVKSKQRELTEESKVKEHSIELENELENPNDEAEPFVEIPAPKAIGRRIKGDKIFDDKDITKNKPPAKIQKIDIWQHEKSITGIQVTYQLSDGLPLQGRLYLDLRAGEKEYQEPWISGTNESIVKIVGRCSKEFGLEKLSIYTNKQRCSHYGNLNSEAEEFLAEFNHKKPPIFIFGSRRVIRQFRKLDRTVIACLGFKIEPEGKRKWHSIAKL